MLKTLGSHVQAHPGSLYFDRFLLVSLRDFLLLCQPTRTYSSAYALDQTRSLTRMRASSAPKKKHNFVVPWHEFCSNWLGFLRKLCFDAVCRQRSDSLTSSGLNTIVLLADFDGLLQAGGTPRMGVPLASE